MLALELGLLASVAEDLADVNTAITVHDLLDQLIDDLSTARHSEFAGGRAGNEFSRMDRYKVDGQPEEAPQPHGQCRRQGGRK